MSVTATIQELLQGIMDSQYGRDMRQFIHDAIQKCYEEGSAGETDLTARESIEKILEIFGDIESTSTASKAYSIGDSVVYDGRLYKVISPINQGDTLTEGTNIEETKASSNIGDAYLLPYTKISSSSISTDNSRLIIVPSIKLMVIDVSLNITGSNVISSLQIGKWFPHVVHKGVGFYRRACAPLFTNTGVAVAQQTGVVELRTPRGTESQNQQSELWIHSIPTREEESTIYPYEAQIVTLYHELNENHPFSEATLLTTY